MKNMLIACLALLAVACTKVEPGYVGIKVNQYGSQKGVDDFPIQTGRVWYNIFTEDVYKFPTFRQNVVWTKDPNEGPDSSAGDADESITFNSSEGAIVNADVAISYAIDPEKVPHVFVEFRKGIEDITLVYLRSEVRNAFNRHASMVRVIDIFGSGKQGLLENVTNDLNSRLGHLGFKFEMVSFVGAPRADKSVMGSINATIEATQFAISAQNKVVQSKAEADQAIETARGRSQSVIIEAQGRFEAMQLEARGNLELTKSLTPELVRYRTIEKWNGTPPQVMGGDFATMLNMKP
jgi:regulator of protease activity HflC (stomatin/prohibitin superfamily)